MRLVPTFAVPLAVLGPTMIYAAPTETPDEWVAKRAAGLGYRC
jgi:hypothetical protein